MTTTKITMRDAIIEQVCLRMETNPNIFFITADLGAPRLDYLRSHFKERFINVGIAEQNLVNVATGLALEGYCVYAMAIAPFLSMRSFEQIRNNLALLSQIKEINVNLLAIGAGMSYEVSGPTHHALEDLSLLNVLPNLDLFSPSDSFLAAKFVDYSLQRRCPKYARLDGKLHPTHYSESTKVDIAQGHYALKEGKQVCLVATGYMTQKSMLIAQKFLTEDGQSLGVVDVFRFDRSQTASLTKTLEKYRDIITLEEGFMGCGGLDSYVLHALNNSGQQKRVRSFGLINQYFFDMGDREYLHSLNGCDVQSISNYIKQVTTSNKTKMHASPVTVN